MVELEIFSGDPPCPGCVAIIDLAERVAARYPGELDGLFLPACACLPHGAEARTGGTQRMDRSQTKEKQRQ
jgi:hypothetical protein